MRKERLYTGLFRLIYLLFTGFFVWVSSMIIAKGYEGTVSFVLDVYGGAEKFDVVTSKLITERSFLIFSIINHTVAALLLLFSIRIWRWFIYLGEGFEIYVNIAMTKWKYFFASFLQLSKPVVVAFILAFLGLIAYKIYLFNAFPLHTDELFSYLHFVDKGLLVTASYYPGPNNHIFYNELCVLVDVFSDNPLIIMRLPTIVISLVTSVVVFIFVKKQFNVTIGLVVFLLFSFAVNVSTYSVLGRGYMLVTLLTILTLISLINIIKEQDLAFYNIMYVISSSLGFYTNPTFIFPFLSLAIFAFNFGLFRRGINVKWILLDTFLVIVVSVGLYTPVILFNGLDAIIDNYWVQARTFGFIDFFVTLPQYFATVNNWLWDMSRGGVWVSMGVFASSFVVLQFVIKRNVEFWTYLMVNIGFFPIVVIILRLIQPYERVWSYFSFFQYLFVGVALYGLVIFVFKSQRTTRYVTVICGALLTVGLVFQLENDLKKGFGELETAQQIGKEIYKNNSETVFVLEDESRASNTYIDFIRLNYIQHNKSFIIRSGFELEEAEIIVVPQSVDFTRGELLVEDDYVKVYRVE